MFDIGFSEILIIAVVALLVMGPERLPQALRSCALWFGRIRQQYRSVRSDLENEMGINDVRRQLHNENILKDLKEAKANFDEAGNDIQSTIDSTDSKQSSDDSQK